jgi:hypothetical protein
MAEKRPAEFPPRLVRCPGCGGENLYAPSNPHRPFCSARCRGGDLGAWASEGYRVPASAEPESEGSEGDPPDA